MRVHRSSGSAAQPGLKPDIEPSTIASIRSMPPTQAVEDAGFALAAMGDEGAHMQPAAR